MSFELAFQHSFDGLALDVSLQGGAGITVLFGPSGSGKTTALRALTGLFRPNTGRAVLQGRTLFDTRRGTWLSPQTRRMGTVFQDGRLFPHLTVAANLDFAQPYRRGRTLPISRPDLVELLGIGDLMARRPATLSGGEAQRVALARALLSAPDMLVMDEPLAALDPVRKEEVLPYLDRLKAEAVIPILYVTHSVDELSRLADDVALIRDGRIVLAGPVYDVLTDPAALPFLGVNEAGAILQARVQRHDADGLSVLESSAGTLFVPKVRAEIGADLRLRIRAQDVILATAPPKGLSARNVLPAVIEALERGRGPGVAVVLRLGDQKILARITERARAELSLEPGQAVFAILKSMAVSRTAING